MRTLLAAIVLATMCASVAHAAESGMTEPLIGVIDPAALEAARIEAMNAPTPTSNDWESPPMHDEALRDRLGSDISTSHYARGRTTIIHIFINDPAHTWSSADMGTAGAEGQLAKDFYLNRSPYAANMSFDGPNIYLYFNPTISWVIPEDPTQAVMNQACRDAVVAIGYADANGNGSAIDDMTLFLQNWGGGTDNVILVFEPHVNGRCYSDFFVGRCVVYMNAWANVWAHEWGHNYHACDEYEEEGHCWNCDCGPCHESAYIEFLIDNGNCELPACPQNIYCIMKYNSMEVAPCGYSTGQWSWTDGDADGLLDRVKRVTGPGSTCWIYEIPHNGSLTWNGVNDGMVVSQRWYEWYAVGMRAPATADYDMLLYGDNNHNFQYTGSNYGAGVVDFVVGDCNHSPIGNEHLAISHYSGDWANYNLSWEGGDQLIFPDGIPRTESWWNGHVVRVWDAPLTAGETVSFNLTNPSGNLDFGMALFRSNGSAYWAGRASAAWQVDVSGIGGGESYTYTAPVDDVYGLVVWANNSADGSLSLQLGPTPTLMAEGLDYQSANPLQLYTYQPYTNYWAFVGTRAPIGVDVRLSLWDDENFTREHSSIGPATGLQFFAADYNHGFDQDYLRAARMNGTSWLTSQWDQGPNIHSGIEELTWNSPDLGKMWDAQLLAGTEYMLRQYHDPAMLLDSGIFFYSSADGRFFKNNMESAASGNSQPGSAGGEWCTFTPTLDDWYGICQIANNETSAWTSLWLGPRFVLAQGDAGLRAERVVWGIEPVDHNYWNVIAARAQPGEAVVVQMFGDDVYSPAHLLGGDGAGLVSFVVGDFNHNPLGYVYSRTYRDTGGGNVTHQWEGGTDQLGFIPGSQWSGDFTWTAGNVVKMWDLYVDGSIPNGQPVRIDVTDLSGQMDLGLEVFNSNGNSVYWSNHGAGTGSDQFGIGGTETVTLTLTAADWYGVVVWNNEGAGGSYRIRVIDPAGMDVADDNLTAFDLRAATLNPFGDATAIEYAVARAGSTELAVYDARGRLVRTLYRGEQIPGSYRLDWDGRDDAGQPVGSGIYFARLKCGAEERKIKLVRAR